MYDIKPVSSSLLTMYSVSKPDLRKVWGKFCILNRSVYVWCCIKFGDREPLAETAKFKLDGFSDVVRDRASTARSPGWWWSSLWWSLRWQYWKWWRLISCEHFVVCWILTCPNRKHFLWGRSHHRSSCCSPPKLRDNKIILSSYLIDLAWYPQSLVVTQNGLWLLFGLFFLQTWEAAIFLLHLFWSVYLVATDDFRRCENTSSRVKGDSSPK